MNGTKLILVAALALSTTGAAALAQPLAGGGGSGLNEVGRDGVVLAHGRGFGRHGGPGGRGAIRAMLREADADNDGAVTQAEVDAFIAQEVSAADDNGDGDLSLQEFQAIFLKFARPAMVDAFQRLDEDGDGAITAAEREERFGRIVARFDRNDDGQLDRSARRGRWGGRGDRNER